MLPISLSQGSSVPSIVAFIPLHQNFIENVNVMHWSIVMIEMSHESWVNDGTFVKIRYSYIWELNFLEFTKVLTLPIFQIGVSTNVFPAKI